MEKKLERGGQLKKKEAKRSFNDNIKQWSYTLIYYCRGKICHLNFLPFFLYSSSLIY